MSTKTEVVPPTYAVAPSPAASCAVVRIGPLTSAIAASEPGSLSSVTVNVAALPLLDCTPGSTLATPLAPSSACWNVASCGWETWSPETRTTVRGSVAPDGSPFCRVSSACVDSTPWGRLELKSNVGLKPIANDARNARRRPDAAANTAGRLPRRPPIAPKRAFVGSTRYFFDG